jgi:hypothetical protein
LERATRVDSVATFPEIAVAVEETAARVVSVAIFPEIAVAVEETAARVVSVATFPEIAVAVEETAARVVSVATLFDIPDREASVATILRKLSSVARVTGIEDAFRAEPFAGILFAMLLRVDSVATF